MVRCKRYSIEEVLWQALCGGDDARFISCSWDTKGATIMIGDHVRGFGFLRNAAVDQHLLRRNRQFDMLSVIEAHPELLGLGIDEDTAIVIQQDQFEVLGRSYVVVYDA